jgi:hypothetical protein
MPAIVHEVRLTSWHPVDKMTRHGRTVGHEFTREIDLEDIRDCTLEWWEKTNVPYCEGMEANTWTDIFALQPTSEVFAPWAFQQRHVRLGRTQFAIIDPPGIIVDTTRARDLFFDIRVRAAHTYHRVRTHQRLILTPAAQRGEIIELLVLENDVPSTGNGPPTW